MKVLLFCNPVYGQTVLESIQSNNQLEVAAICCRLRQDTLLSKSRKILAQVAYDLKLRRPKAHLLHAPSVSDQWILKYARQRNIPVLSPDNQKKDCFYDTIKPLQADLVLSFGYPKLIPERILKATALGGVNIHPGRLPQRGGGTPIRWAVYKQDQEVGLYAHAMTARFDAGSLLDCLDILIDDHDDAGRIETKLLSHVPNFLDGLLKTIKTDQRRFDTVSDLPPDILPPFRGADQRIDWSRDTGAQIIKKTQAMRPKSGAITAHCNEAICIYDLETVSCDEKYNNTQPGAFIGFGQHQWPLIKTRDGCVVIKAIIYGNKTRSGRLLPWYYGIKPGDIFA
ncbi:MAG: formyltransferase family protein [Bdellovibrionales bacterium]